MNRVSAISACQFRSRGNLPPSTFEEKENFLMLQKFSSKYNFLLGIMAIYLFILKNLLLCKYIIQFSRKIMK
jgi:hypothetical protein